MVVNVTQAKKKLQIVATPIGNLQEISFRAIDAFKKCQCILCEDTRVTSKILSKFAICNKQLISYQKFNENNNLDFIINKIKTSATILCSDAGYPCISDPGYTLINACYKNNIAIEVINGPSSLMHALAVSGLNLDNFYFNGFLSNNKTKRKQKLKQLANFTVPIVFFEAVHRIKQTLKDIYEILNDPFMVVCRELTKINETIYRGQYNDIIAKIILKGEFVVIVNNHKVKKTNNISQYDLINDVKALMKKEKISLKQACKIIAKKINKKTSFIYNSFVQNKESNNA